MKTVGTGAFFDPDTRTLAIPDASQLSKRKQPEGISQVTNSSHLSIEKCRKTQEKISIGGRVAARTHTTQ